MGKHIINRLEEAQGVPDRKAFLRSHLYIACSTINFDWFTSQVETFDYLWNEGRHLKDIAAFLKRNEIEVYMLYLDRIMEGFIKPDLHRVLYTEQDRAKAPKKGRPKQKRK